MLRRMQTGGDGERAARIDRYVLWSYPLLYLAAVAIVVIWRFA